MDQLIDALGSIRPASLAVARLLAEGLASEEEARAESAAYAISHPSPAGKHAVKVLRESLTSTSARARGLAAGALGSLYKDGRSAAPDLCILLRDQDPTVRAAAAQALSSVDAYGDEVAAALTEALNDPIADVRRSALLAFFNLRDTVNVPESEVETRLRDNSASVRSLAAELFVKLCGADPIAAPACIEALGSGSVDSPTDLRYMVDSLGPMTQEAALYLADRVHRTYSSGAILGALVALGPDAAPAASALLEALDTDDAGRFGQASKALVQATPRFQELLSVLRQAFRNSTPEIRPLAAAALWRLGQHRDESLAMLLSGLRDPVRRIRDSAVNGLASMGREVISPLVTELLDLGSAGRPGAAAALGRLGANDPAVVSAIGSLVGDDHDHAINALITLGADTTGPLLQALQSSDPTRRSRAMWRIRAYGHTNAEFRRPLEKILTGELPGDRVSAAMVLLLMDPNHEHAAHVLARAAAEDEQFDGDSHGDNSRELTTLANTSPAAVEALLVFHRRSNAALVYSPYSLEPTGDGQAPFVPPLTAAVSSPDEPTRFFAAHLLKDSGAAGLPAVPALIACLDDTSARVRTRSARTLGAIGPAAAPLATAALTRQLEKRQDPLLRANAIGALGDLGPPASSCLPALLEIVRREKDEPLRCLALEAAVCIGGKSAIEPDLRAQLQRGPSTLRRYANLLHVDVAK